MKVAAIVYVVSAIVALGAALYLMLADGPGVGLFMSALTAVVLLAIVRGLSSGRSGATTAAIVTSSFVAVGFLSIPLYGYAQGGWARILHLWPILVPLVGIAIAHSVALVYLLRTKPSAG